MQPLILSTTCVPRATADAGRPGQGKERADGSVLARLTSAGSTPPSATARVDAEETLAAAAPAYLTIDESTPGSVSAAAKSPQPQEVGKKAAAAGLDEEAPVYLSRGQVGEAWHPSAQASGCEMPLAIKQIWASTAAEESPSFIVKDLNATFDSVGGLEAQARRSPSDRGDKLWEAIEDMLRTPTRGTPCEAGSREPSFGIYLSPGVDYAVSPLTSAPSPALVLRLADALPGSIEDSPGSSKAGDVLVNSPGSQVLRIAEALPGPELGSPAMPTQGSVGHGMGSCKPCAFVHSKGCDNGVECPFCHLCKPDEIRRRKKAKRASKHGVICLDLDSALDPGAVAEFWA